MVRSNLPSASVVCLIFCHFIFSSSLGQNPSPGYVGLVPQQTSGGGGGGGGGAGGGASSYPVQGLNDIEVVGDYAYCVTASNEFFVIDISTPYSPVIAAKLVNGSGPALLNGPAGVFVSGNYAYIAAGGNNALEIIDISNPAAPIHAGSISDSPIGAELTGAKDVIVVGNYAYVSRQGGLEIVDVTDRTAPVHKSKIEFGLGMPSNGMAMSAPYVYTNNSFSFSVTDVSDPANPVVVATVNDNGNTVRINEPSAPVIKGNYLYMTSRNYSTLEVFDISNPLSPTPAGFIADHDGGAFIENPTAVAINGNYAFVTNGDAPVLEIVDISTPTSPTHKTLIQGGGSLTFLTSSRKLAVTSNYAFIGTGFGLEIFYLFTPSPPATDPATATAAGGFAANWKAVHNATGYELDVSADDFSTFVTGYNSLSLASSTLTKTISDLDPTVTYKYRVRAKNVNGTSPNSKEITTTATPGKPSVSISNITQTGFHASWDAVPGATGYLYYASKEMDFDPLLNIPSGGVDNFLTLSGLSPATTYYVAIVSVTANLTGVDPDIHSVVTIPGTPVPHDADPIGQTSFTANWSASEGATGYFVDVKSEDGTILDGYNDVAVSSGTSLIVNDGIEAGTVYSFVVRAKNESGTTPSSEEQDVITIPPTPVATPAEVSGTISFLATWGSARGATGYNINVYDKNDALLPGYSNFDAGSNLNTTVTVNAPATGATYTYRVSARNVSGSSPFSEAVTVNTPATSFPAISLPTGGSVEAYAIVSIPDGTVASSNLAAESFAKTWRVMQYDNASDDVVDFPNIADMKPGKGYWVNSNFDEAPVITVTGQTTGSDKTLTLKPGWNQIGNPLHFDILWSDVLNNNSDVAGVGNLYVYSAGFSESDQLKAYGGGFVNNTNTSDIQLTISTDMESATARKGGKAVISSRDISGTEWFLPITLEFDMKLNTLAGIGMHPEARNSIDPFDAVALPRFFNLAEISSYHPEFFQPRFMRDVVTTASSYTWTLNVAGEDRGKTKLSWDNTAWSGSMMYLIDEKAGVIVNMSEVSEYEMNDKSTSIKVCFSKDGHFNSDITALGNPYPNPSSDRVVFPFMLADGEFAHVNIIDMTGKVVQVLSGEKMTSGYNELAWDNKHHPNVSPGMYLFQARTSGGKYKTGRIVIR